MVEDGTGGFVGLTVASGVGACAWIGLLLYNVIALVGFLRTSATEGAASPLSKAAWATGFLSFLAGPCAWLLAVAAIVMAAVERQRIYQDKSTYASAGPCRHANVNAGAVLLITSVMWVAVGATWLG